jgi:hypothetical protein
LSTQLMHKLDERSAVGGVGKGQEGSREDAELIEVHIGQLLVARLCRRRTERRSRLVSKIRDRGRRLKKTHSGTKLDSPQSASSSSQSTPPSAPPSPSQASAASRRSSPGPASRARSGRRWGTGRGRRWPFGDAPFRCGRIGWGLRHRKGRAARR